VKDPATAAVLADPRRRRILLALVGAELSLSALAEAAGMRLNLVHYHLQRLLAAGLVVSTRAQPRAGRPVRYYTAAWDGFFVPDALLAQRPAHRLAAELEAALDHARGEGGVLYELDEERRPRMTRLEDQDAPSRAFEIWRIARLDPRDAAALANEMMALVRRYEARSPDARDSWIVHAALARR
jgi:DNA-binding transcriptional ArsR family regulator